ncbi:caldesmon-like [Harpegnathos saltator]|uniref:caldesmon-like n=1 Tax=Harpegnathos saltator TaxID=610380 RepID=UPI000DBEEE27|nr:caldesmon-like [Harpegnathos saltator]
MQDSNYKNKNSEPSGSKSLTDERSSPSMDQPPSPEGDFSKVGTGVVEVAGIRQTGASSPPPGKVEPADSRGLAPGGPPITEDRPPSSKQHLPDCGDGAVSPPGRVTRTAIQRGTSMSLASEGKTPAPGTNRPGQQNSNPGPCEDHAGTNNGTGGAKDTGGGRKRTREATNTSGSSSSTEIPTLEPKKREPGWLPTTGERVGAKKKKEMEIERKEEDNRKLEEDIRILFDTGMLRSLEDRRPIEEVFRDNATINFLREARVVELASEVGRALGAVRGHLRGCYGHPAGENGGAGQPGEEASETKREAEELRAELKKLRVENRRLGEELEAIKAFTSSAPAPLPTPFLRGRRLIYAEAAAGSTSASSEEEEKKTKRETVKRRKKERKREITPSSPSSLIERKGAERGESTGEIPSYDDNAPETPPPPTWRTEKAEEELDAAMAAAAPACSHEEELRRMRAELDSLKAASGMGRAAVTVGIPATTTAQAATTEGEKKKQEVPKGRTQALRTSVDLKGTKGGARKEKRKRQKKRRKERARRMKEEEERRAREGGKGTPAKDLLEAIRRPTGSQREPTAKDEPKWSQVCRHFLVATDRGVGAMVV